MIRRFENNQYEKIVGNVIIDFCILAPEIIGILNQTWNKALIILNYKGECLGMDYFEKGSGI